MMGTNLILVVLDTVRPDHLSCYGYHRPISPEIERLANAGVVFREAISSACWTLPAHASLFTGLYSSQHGATQAHPVLLAEIPTLAEALRGAGYATLGLSNNPWVGRNGNLDKGFDVFREWQKASSSSSPFLPRSINRRVHWLRKRLGILVPEHAAKRTVDEAVSLVSDGLRQGKQQFFLFINLMDAHAPRRAPGRFVKTFVREEYRKPEFAEVHVIPFLTGQMEYTERDFEAFAEHYDAAIAYLDSQLGRLFGHLKRLGILDNSLVCIMADHGDHLGEHGLLGHNISLYDTLIRVPLVMYWPGTLSAGREVDIQVETKSLFTTLLDAAGVSSHSANQLNNVNLLDVAMGRTQGDSGSRFAFAEDPDPALFRRRWERAAPALKDARLHNSLRCVRTSNHKFIWSENGDHEFYDLRRDPGETENLYGQGHVDQVKLETELDRWQQTVVPVVQMQEASVRGLDEMDDEVLDRLRTLGYID